MSKPIKYPFIVTPRAFAAFTWLDKPDTAFGDEKYKVTLVFNKDDLSEGRIERGSKALSGSEWFKYIIDLCKKHGVAHKPGERGCPIKDGDKMVDKEGNPREQFANSWVIQLKSGFKPDLLDTKGNKLPSNVNILNGDVIKALIVPAYRNVNGADYLSLYLNKVALVEKRVDSKLDASVFGEEDGYVVPQDEMATALSDSDVADTSDYVEEDVDF